MLVLIILMVWINRTLLYLYTLKALGYYACLRFDGHILPINYKFLHWWLLNCLDLALSAVYYCSRQGFCQQIRSKLSFPKIIRKLWRRLTTYISFHQVKILKHASHTWGCGTGMESTILCLRFAFWNLRAFPAAKSHLLLDLDFWSWCYSYPNS